MARNRFLEAVAAARAGEQRAVETAALNAHIARRRAAGDPRRVNELGTEREQQVGAGPPSMAEASYAAWRQREEG